MFAEYKYPIGKKVFFKGTENIPSYYNCPNCEGEGVIFKKSGTPIECGRCCGRKKISDSGSIKEVVLEAEVRVVQMYLTDESNTITYQLKDVENRTFNQDELYNSEEEVKSTFVNGVMGYTSISGVIGNKS